MSRTVTLIIHGTFAYEGGWWRLGGKCETTFADCLENELSRHGLSGTVWEPVLREGYAYSSFAWPDDGNKHSDRLKGARKLSLNINRFAQRTGAIPSDPLTVNFVAHSHGGNVVLESTRTLASNVRVGRVVLLGTPLVTARPAFRIGRFVFSTALLFLFFLVFLLLIVQFGTWLFTGHFLDTEPQFGLEGQLVREGISGAYLVSILLPTLLAYGWIFWAFGNLLDVAWRVLCRCIQPLTWLRGKSNSLVYGPSPRKLERILGGEPILSLTTLNDEADLLLQVTSAPARLYMEYVATGLSKMGRLLELIFLRPFVLGVLLKAGEVLLERISLGFSLWRSLFVDLEVAPMNAKPYYPPNLLIREKIDASLDVNFASAKAYAAVTRNGPTTGTPAHGRGLRVSLKEVTNEIKRQIQLRHSMYYENPAVIRRVARFLTEGKPEDIDETSLEHSLKPSDGFWEALLVGNVTLAILFAWIAGAALPHPILPFSIFMTTYIAPFLVLGIIVLFYRIGRQHWPVKLWRWFWNIWAVWGLMIVLAALGERAGG